MNNSMAVAMNSPMAVSVRTPGIGKGHRYSMYWTLEKEILLIKYFEQHRYLWDTNHILFHKREPRMQSFAELVHLLGIDEGTIRQRWSSMRSQFCREERKVSLCPTYVPTWDHYCALQFLRKPYEEGVGEELSNSVGMLEDGEEYEDAVTEDPKQDEPSKSNGFDWNKLVRQLDQTRSGENDKTDGEVDYINEGASSAVMDSVKSESPSEFSQYSVVQPPTPSQLIRKHRTPRQRRWTPGYNKKYQEIANVASASISSNTSNTNVPIQPPLEPIRTSTENEAFTQYIASVLDRFPADKQRRCRNEILCVLLQYDSCEDNVILSTASDRK